MWVINNIDNTTTEINFQQKSMDAVTGEYSVHFWGEAGTKFDLTQDIKNLSAGKYSLTMSIQGGFDNADTTQNIYIFCKVNGTEYTANTEITEWINWHTPVIKDIEVPENAEVTIGIHVEAAAGSWGSIDDVLLNPVK